MTHPVPLGAALVAAFIAAPLAAQDAPAGQATLSAAWTDAYGTYLVDADGRPVYAFVTDPQGSDGLPPLESCNAPCREDWPPLMATGETRVEPPLDPGLAGRMAEGETQVVTYGGHPLFRFARDVPGVEPQGQGIHTYGGWWQLIRPDGTVVPDEVLYDDDVL